MWLLAFGVNVLVSISVVLKTPIFWEPKAAT